MILAVAIINILIINSNGENECMQTGATILAVLAAAFLLNRLFLRALKIIEGPEASQDKWFETPDASSKNEEKK